MRRFIVDLDDTLAWTTRDLQGDPNRIPQLTLVPGALQFLQTHKRRCILLTAGNESEQQQKIKVLGIRRCFKKIYVVPEPKDKLDKLEEIVKKLGSQTFPIKSYNIVVIGDRLDTEIRKGNEMGCVTVRVKIPGGRHSNEMALGAKHEVPHFEVVDFDELIHYFPL